MTRKRKNVETFETSGSSGAYCSSYNNQTYNEDGFPKKRNQNKKSWDRKCDFDADSFSQKYGYIGEESEHQLEGFKKDFGDRYIKKNWNKYSNEHTESSQTSEESQAGFPTEIVTYLKNIWKMTENGPLDDIVLERCSEEIRGLEETLCKYPDSCKVVENVFGSSPKGAILFLTALIRIKHKRLLDLMFSLCSVKTIEKLLYSLCPIKDNSSIEVLTKFVDILCDNWRDSVTSSAASFLIRAIARITSGLESKKQQQKGQAAPVDNSRPKFTSKEMESNLKKLFDRLIGMGADFPLMKPMMDSVQASFVMQDLFECESKTGWSVRADSFAMAAIEATEEIADAIRISWRGQSSSRVWEKIVQCCKEDTRQMLWMGVISGKTLEFAKNATANFPLQRLIACVKSLELATDVMDDLCPHLSVLIDGERMGVVGAMAECAGRHEDLQNAFLKALRKHFNASKVSNKTHFLFNVLSLNDCDPENFNMDKVKLQGSLLLENLLKLSKTRTLSTCLESLTANQLMEMAKHRTASHVLEAFLKSSNVDGELKCFVATAFENRWEQLIDDPYGSHVFEKIWDNFTLAKKMNFMKQIVPIRPNSKFWKYMLLRTNMYLFRKDKAEWCKLWRKEGQLSAKDKKLKHKEDKKSKKAKKRANRKARLASNRAENRVLRE